MAEPHPQVQSAREAAAALDGADQAARVQLLETLADRLDAALTDQSG